MSEGDATLYEVDRGIATITLNRPENSNALSPDLLNGLLADLKRAIDDDAARLVVLTNNGRAFCAGADLKAKPGSNVQQASLVDVFETMFSSPKPVIGRIAGHCMGGGVGLAAACDISVAADDVRFGFTEVRIGAAPAIISVVVLAKMRRADAMELFLSGERIEAQRAAEVGLINQAVPRDGLDAAVTELVDKVLAGAPNALAKAKDLVNRVPTMTQPDAFAWTAKLSAELFRTDEAAEGMAAFREKRKASWVPE